MPSTPAVHGRQGRAEAEPALTVIYLDYNATAPLRPQARAAMLEYLGDEFGNPSSVHRLGSRARVAVEAARVEVAGLIGARANEIVFTSGGTESNNLAVLGAATMRQGAIVTTAIEHSSVLAPVAMLKQSGRPVVLLAVDRCGRIDLSDLQAAVRQEPALVSIGWANNEIGTIQPMAQIAPLCRAAGVPLHVDAVQALGKIAVHSEVADLISLSAHKIGGPKGVGALWVRTGTRIAPLHHGGSQERGVRGGTENVAGIVGFGVACRLLAEEGPLADQPCAQLRERLWADLVAAVEGIERNSSQENCLPNTLNVRIPGVRGDTLVAALDLEGIAVSTGSACAAGAAEPSHVLRAIGLPDDDARDGLRFSLGWATTPAEIDRTVGALERVVRRVRAVPRQVVAYA